jgi:hypothetical protein
MASAQAVDMVLMGTSVFSLIGLSTSAELPLPQPTPFLSLLTNKKV